jgi:excisionase family DNA binding protein
VKPRLSPAPPADAAGALLSELLQLPGLVRELQAELRSARAELAEIKARLPPSLVSIEEAVRLTGVSESTLRRRIREGSLPVTRIGRAVRIDTSHLTPVDDDEVARLAFEARHGGS